MATKAMGCEMKSLPRKTLGQSSRNHKYAMSSDGVSSHRAHEQRVQRQPLENNRSKRMK